MAEVGRLALVVAGQAAFGPFGALAGGLLGNVLFPVEGPKGPRLQELNVQHSTVGAPIPLVFGTGLLAGNIIFSGGLVETKHESGGGKGGPSGPTTYSYAVDVAIGICEGPIDGIRRIWADADLIYDASDDETLEERLTLQGVDFNDIANAIAELRALSTQTFEALTIYLGTEDQLPDPTIESHLVAGTVPAFRGLAYIVFTNFQLEKYGNRIPNFRFEVYSGLTEAVDCTQYSAGVLYPWATSHDPRNDANTHEYAPPAAYNTWTTNLTSAFADLETVAGRPVVNFSYGWTNASTDTQSEWCLGNSIGEAVEVWLNFNTLEAPIHCEQLPITGSPGPDSQLGFDFKNYFGMQTVVWWNGEAAGGSTGDLGGFWVRIETGESEADYFGGYSQAGSFATLNPAGTLQYLTNIHLKARRTIQPPDPCSGGVFLAGTNEQFCVVNGVIVPAVTWVLTAGTYKVLQDYTVSGNTVTKYPGNPALPLGHDDYSNQSFWEAAYADALAAGLVGLAPGLTYGVDYPVTVSSAWVGACDQTAVVPACVPMATIVAALCARAGLRTDTATQIDVSDLTTCVTGYIVGRQMSARDALQPLRMFGLWDAAESGELLKFIERGHAIGATLTDDDLGVHENGSQAPSKLEVSRTQEKELPRRLRLHFPNFLHDHEVSEQSASRITTEAIDELDVELAIAMEPDTAKQLAEIMLYEAWVSRNRYRFALDHDWLHLEPTDCVEIPVDGQTERVRIVAVEYRIGGVLQIDAVRDDDGAYESTAIATPGAPSGGVPGSSGGGPICPSAAVLLDIPCLDGVPPTGETWIYAAIYGQCSNFDCAALYRSSDGGESYAQVATTDAEATVGDIIDITGPPTDPAMPGESPQFDSSDSITVQMLNGELSSITDAQLAAGQNLAAIGVDGRWVIIQFQTAVLTTTDTYELSEIIWGVNDTRHLLGTTIVGDSFVLLSDAALLRIPLPESAIGVAQQWKVVTCGESLDAVEEFAFTTWGLCYQRTCPSTVISATTTSPPTGALDGDAYLLPNDTSLSGDWETHGGEVAFWSEETESWQFCTPVPGTIIHIIPPGESSSAPGGEDVISGGDGTYNPAPWPSRGLSFVTVEDESAGLPNSARLVAGTNVTLDVDTSNTVTIHATGGGGSSTGGAHVYRAATPQAVGSGTDTPVTFDTEVHDDSTYATLGTNNDRFTVPATGWYALSGTAEFQGNATGLRALYFRVNGSASLFYGYNSNEPESAGNIGLDTQAILRLTAGDYVQMMAAQNSGLSLNLNLSVGRPYMTIHRLS